MSDLTNEAVGGRWALSSRDLAGPCYNDLRIVAFVPSA